MEVTRDRRNALVEEIARQLLRRYSTAVVLFHHAIAERLGLGPTDHKCFDLLSERGRMTASELAAITGVTTGAITGVVARLERGGYLRREPDPHDRRKQILYPQPDRMRDVQNAFDPIQDDGAAWLAGLDVQQLATIAEFLTGSTELVHRHSALLRAQKLTAASGKGST